MHENFNTKIIRNAEAKELNVFYWSVVIPSLRITIIEYVEAVEGHILNEIDKTTIHSYLKQRFLNGTSTKDLTTDEFNDYIEKTISLIQTLSNGQNSYSGTDTTNN